MAEEACGAVRLGKDKDLSPFLQTRARSTRERCSLCPLRRNMYYKVAGCSCCLEGAKGPQA